MNQFIKKAIIGLYKRLDKTIKGWAVEPEGVTPAITYHSLSPIKNADVNQYLEALTWALDNRKEESIYNIALTGPYGSGKSSILQTFKDKNENKDYVFLEISLATFKEEAEEKESLPDSDNDDKKDDKKEDEKQTASPKKNEEILRLIELSILQQIFYHEEDSKIPDSRFKKIRSFKRKNMIWITAGIMAALLFGLNLFFPEKITLILKLTFPPLLALILHWLSLIVFLISLSIIIFRSIRLTYGLKISKFKFKEAEIEIDKGISKSILNNHLDEILYFFEVTGYSVVLIEDLDRFRQAEIFTKLRELNLLINKSKKVKQEVVFIYAVRDEMFQDKDRTKFFDFIIPVIPVINSSNSNEKLAKIIGDNKYGISPDLIDDMALFIDDMRLLYNITNEYHIYHELLSEELDQDKLMAMIVYKNIYPDDFVLLSKAEGKLFTLLNKRQKYIVEAINTLDSGIKSLKIELKQIEAIQIKDADQLRMVYLLNYVGKISGFQHFVINGTVRNLLDVANDEDLFAYLVANDVAYNYYYNQYGTNYNTQKQTDLVFKDIEDSIDTESTYEERLELINDYWEDREEVIKSELQNLEKRKVAVRHLKLQEILTDKSTNVDIDSSTKQGLLLRLLLRSGYINEDYLDYISLFYEGSITKIDRSFLLNVKSQSALAYDYALSKIPNLISKIRVLDFQQPYLLNYNLLDFMLVNAGYRSQLDNIINQLNDGNDYGLTFIEGFVTNGINIEIFVREICAKWPGIWKYISIESDLTKERKEEYFKLIVANADLEDLKKIAELSNLSYRIALTDDFLSLIPDEERLEQVISTLNIKFNNLDMKTAPKRLLDFVYKGNYYKIIPAMIEQTIQARGSFNRSNFDHANYQAIQQSDLPELITYIETNINDYMADIYLQIPTNTKEPEIELLKLLNNKDIKLAHLFKVIEKVETKITDITTLTSQRTDENLFEESKVSAVWQNLIEYFARDKGIISPAMVTFLNNDDNAKTLATGSINIDDPSPDLETVEAFMLALVSEVDIDDISYEILLPVLRYDYELDDIKEVGNEKMRLLVDYFMIKPNAENFGKLKTQYPGLQLLFLEKSKADFLADIEAFAPDANDINNVLESASFTPDEKKELIESIDVDLIVGSNKILKTISKLIFNHHPFKVSKQILIAVLQQSLAIGDRVKLFNMHYTQFNNADIPVIFKTFPYPYSDIGVPYTSPVIDHGQENAFLANNLKGKNFIANVKNDKKGIRLINFKKG
jgi:KAP family P-loop domain